MEADQIYCLTFGSTGSLVEPGGRHNLHAQPTVRFQPERIAVGGDLGISIADVRVGGESLLGEDGKISWGRPAGPDGFVTVSVVNEDRALREIPEISMFGKRLPQES